MSSSGSDVQNALSTDEKLVFLANTLAALSSAVAAIALALRLSRQGKLMKFMRNDEVESSMPLTKGGTAVQRIGISESPAKWEIDPFIRRRAEKIGKLAADMLVDGEANPPAIEAFKFAHLVLRGPRQFVARFKGGGLEIDSGEVETFISENEGTLFYGSNSYLLTEEERLISSHNLNVSLLGSY